MSILDIFSFKKKIQEALSPENIVLLKAVIKEAIIKQVKAKMPGEEKMNEVIKLAEEFISTHIKSDNKLVQWFIDTFIINNIRPIAQSIYEDLKQIVKGL